MAVYTDVSDEALRNFLADYDIGELIAYRGIAEGVENSNYSLRTGGRDHRGGDYILTLYEKRVNPADLPWFLGLMGHLSDHGVVCPQPVPARDETDISDRIRRHQACAPAPIVERQTGSETMADPARFARPAGEGERTAASVQMSGSNGHSVVNTVLTQRSIYAGNRQARRHPNP